MINPISRLKNHFSGKIRQFLTKLEWQNPKAVYAKVLKDKQEKADKFLEAVAKSKSKVETARKSLENKINELNCVETQLREAVSVRDECNGSRLCGLQVSLSQEIEEERQELEIYQSDVEELEWKLSDICKDLDSFKRKSLNELSGIELAKAKKDFCESTLVELQTPAEEALEAIQERLAVEQQRESILIKHKSYGRKTFQQATRENLDAFRDLCSSMETSSSKGEYLPDHTNRTFNTRLNSKAA